jgi:alkanesulfonate monooxygenase SsuD/methylene tetrahydromethanopterin reductase-like flavin-dependent oxidoreductase (luciferase family)
MNVGIYLDLRNPPQWRQDPARVFGFALEVCEEAERLGAHSIWLSEHHLFEDGYLPQPLTFAAAVAARTTRVRIGTAVLLAPMRSAVQIAEEAAVVDLLSSGRLELGLGAGYRLPEFELFDADITRRYTTTDARARELRELWDAGRLTPEPAQARVPIWMGYQGPRGARRAGLLGEGLLSASGGLYEPYRSGLEEGGHDPSIGRMAGNIPGVVTDDPDREWSTLAPYAAYQTDSYRRYAVEGTGRAVPNPVDPERLRQGKLGVILGSFLCATPEDAAAQIRRYTEGAPVETVFLWASIAGMPEQGVLRHVETICGRLAPLLAA